MQVMALIVWHNFFEWMDDKKNWKHVNTWKVKMIWNGEYGDRHDKSLTRMLSSSGQKLGILL